MTEMPSYPILRPSDRTYGCCYDREGRPISFDTYDLLRTPKYAFVARTYFPDGLVSTVWTGNNTEVPPSRPTMFGTLIRTRDRRSPLYGWEDTYSSLAEAEAGHARCVAMLEEHTGQKGESVEWVEGQVNWAERDDAVFRDRLGCAHCGKALGPFSAGIDGVSVCHTIWVDGQPTEAQTDCYKLVTVYGETLGSRMSKVEGD